MTPTPENPYGPRWKQGYAAGIAAGRAARLETVSPDPVIEERIRANERERLAAATPDPPDGPCHICGEPRNRPGGVFCSAAHPPAASPDERLREALERIANPVVKTKDERVALVIEEAAQIARAALAAYREENTDA